MRQKSVLGIQTYSYLVHTGAFGNDGSAILRDALFERTGMYQIGVRLYAKNALLPHRMDFPLVKWL